MWPLGKHPVQEVDKGNAEHSTLVLTAEHSTIHLSSQLNILHLSSSLNTVHLSSSLNTVHLSSSLNTVHLSSSLNTVHLSSPLSRLLSSAQTPPPSNLHPPPPPTLHQPERVTQSIQIAEVQFSWSGGHRYCHNSKVQWTAAASTAISNSQMFTDALVQPA